MVLRDYQQNQLIFSLERLEVSNTVAVESPTGSGKTFVILELAKQWLKNHPMDNVIISTGFNHLVFLMEKRAEQMGINPVVIIGAKAVNCPAEWSAQHKELPFKPFTSDRSCNCGKKHLMLDVGHKDMSEKKCPYTTSAYNDVVNKISEGVGQIVITNHSTFLAHQGTDIWKSAGLLIVDEAHTFSTFYDTWVSLELDENDLMRIDKAINSLKPPMNMIIKNNIKNGRMLPQQQIDALTDKLTGETKIAAKEFFGTKPAPNNWIEMDGETYKVNRFYRTFEMSRPKTLLMSATLDEFTLQMFEVRRVDIYRETKQFCDYSKSEFLAIPREGFKQAFLEFLDHVNEKGLNRGLCLSTTISDMKIALSCDGHENYRMISDLNEFLHANKNERLILCGSRALFQGIDIPDLNFVCLNRIPFPNWNEKAKAQQDFLTNNGKNGFDPWLGFTVPKTQNDILQSSGRLWRNSESYGVVGIFDERMERHAYMIKNCFDKYRHGIKINIIREQDKPVEKWM